MKKHIDVVEKINNEEPLSHTEQTYIQSNKYFSETLHSIEGLTQSILKLQNDLNLLIEKAEEEPQEGEESVCINCAFTNTILNSTEAIKYFEFEKTMDTMAFLLDVRDIFSPHH